MQCLAILGQGLGLGVVMAGALDQDQALGLARRIEQLPAQLAGISGSAVPCTTSSGEPMSATLSTELKRCVINQFTGSQPQRMESKTSGMLVKVDSTSTPLSS